MVFPSSVRSAVSAFMDSAGALFDRDGAVDSVVYDLASVVPDVDPDGRYLAVYRGDAGPVAFGVFADDAVAAYVVGNRGWPVPS